MTDRQDRLSGFSTAILQRSRVLVIGGGGLIAGVAPLLVRQGIGSLLVVDADQVEPSNYNRQFFYGEDDLYVPKAHALAKNLAREGHLGGVVEGIDVSFTAENAAILAADVDAIVVGVDNNRCRREASAFARQCGLPLVSLAVDHSASFGAVFVQEARTGPCLACVDPTQVECSENQREACRPTPSAIEILRLVGAAASYAVTTLLMPKRTRQWNWRTFDLTGTRPETRVVLAARPDCPYCLVNNKPRE